MKETPFEIDEYDNQGQPPARWKSALSLIAIVILVFVLIRVLFALVVPIVTLILLVANRDLVAKVIRMIYQLYQDELYKGLLATVASFFLFAPFVVFLFFRTIYYMFVEGDKTVNEYETESNSDSEIINIVIKEKVKNLLRDEDNTY